MTNLRKATLPDLNFLVEADLFDKVRSPWKNDSLAHRERILSFIEDTDKGAWICEIESKELVGMILWRNRNRLTESLPEWSIFNYIDSQLFPQDGNFCEIFQLWVDPKYRRKGIGTQLKSCAEIEARARGLKMIYTHTKATNAHVISLNIKLGYREIRRGTIWDEVERVSLVKYL